MKKLKVMFAVFVVLAVFCPKSFADGGMCSTDKSSGGKKCCKTNFSPKNVHTPSASDSLSAKSAS